MDITRLPFNEFLGIRKCEEKEEGIFELLADPKYLNHVDTVHATAIYGLGEATSGQFLSDNLKIPKDSIVPVLRRTEIKYRKPAIGWIYSRAVFNQDDWDQFYASLEKRGRGLIAFQVDILDEEDVVVATGSYEWFIAKKPSDWNLS